MINHAIKPGLTDHRVLINLRNNILRIPDVITFRRIFIEFNITDDALLKELIETFDQIVGRTG